MANKSNLLSPIRFREIDDAMLVTNEIGQFRIIDQKEFISLMSDFTNHKNHSCITGLSSSITEKEEWKLASLKYNIDRRFKTKSKKKFSYLIIVPTLRCNLSCSYCQVSRAPINAKGYDWDDDQLRNFFRFIGDIDSDHIKIEFQGGEPTLRPDLIEKIIQQCEKNFKSTEFVVCTNLGNITPAVEKIFDRDNVFISTSIDGPQEIMTLNRTESEDETDRFFSNLQYVINKYGPDKVSALPTITDNIIKNPRKLIDFYIDLGFESIFLRPVNYVGFARKAYGDLTKQYDAWKEFYNQAISYMVEINQTMYFEDFYLSLLLRSIFIENANGFVDFRSPNFFANDYCVIDFDGKIYPTDEARMLSRTNYIDLEIGNLIDGLKQDKIDSLNKESMNQTNPECLHCAYMPYCGVDLIDDISRHGRIDVPKQDTWFCTKQMHLFDMIFSKIINKEKDWLNMFSKWIFRNNKSSENYSIFYD